MFSFWERVFRPRAGTWTSLSIPYWWPALPIFVNIAATFYQWGLNGTLVVVVLVHSLPGLVYAVWIVTTSIFVFLDSIDEFTGTFFVGAPEITTLPLLMFNASMAVTIRLSRLPP